MMHPDQLYSVRQLQHQDLLAEAEQARGRGGLAGTTLAGRLVWLAAWLRGATMGKVRGAAPAGPPERGTAA